MFALTHGDCLQEMALLADKSVDMILSDLPYGTTNCKWDICIPLDLLWAQYKRIIKDNGVIALFGSEPFSTYLRMSNIEWYKYDWIWMKNTCTGYQHAKNMPMKNYENICIFSNGGMGHKSLLKERRMIYNPQGIKSTHIQHNNAKRKFGSVVGARPSNVDEYVQTETGYPKMVLEFDSENQRVHPTQKPVPLLKYLIKTYTNIGDTVLDGCMGSGSTGIACLETDRSFIGIELEEKYFKIAKERMETHCVQMEME